MEENERPNLPAKTDRRFSHGARSEAQIRPVARAQKRRLLRQIGLSASQLDGIALGYIDSWARAQAKTELMDFWIAQHGLIDAEGNLPGFMATYVACLNSARLALVRLEGHLKARDLGGAPSMVAVLQGHATRRDER